MTDDRRPRHRARRRSRSASARSQANRDVSLSVAAGLDPRHRRRERGRQIDADVDPLRLLRGRFRRDQDRRHAAAHPLAGRCDRGRHRHGPPAFHAGRDAERGRERRARGRGRRLAQGRARPGAGRAGAALAGLRPRHRSRRHRRRSLGRPAAARRDPEGALSRRRHPDPRRADRRADAAGGRPALSPAAGAEARRARR